MGAELDDDGYADAIRAVRAAIARGDVQVEGAKDAAEHVMIVDLERNLARVCEPGSIRWPELLAERELAGVAHVVSTVEGALRPGGDLEPALTIRLREPVRA